MQRHRLAVDIDRTLTACEAALSRPGKIDLTALGFWRAVSAVKRRPELVVTYGQRIARIDREAFLRSAPIALPAPIGIWVEALGTIAVLAALAVAPRLPVLGSEFVYIAGTGGLIALTHGLAHVVVGSAMGMRFTHVYSLPPFKPQPGFKIDYATYLRVPARSRAWMHASGALVSKAVPFAVAAYAAANGTPQWTLAIILAIGVGQLITDATLSTRLSDWKKFRREMRFAG
jgi:hypothetical protein